MKEQTQRCTSGSGTRERGTGRSPLTPGRVLTNRRLLHVHQCPAEGKLSLQHTARYEALTRHDTLDSILPLRDPLPLAALVTEGVSWEMEPGLSSTNMNSKAPLCQARKDRAPGHRGPSPARPSGGGMVLLPGPGKSSWSALCEGRSGLRPDAQLQGPPLPRPAHGV